MIRENFLQQNAFHDIDTYCPDDKQYEMLRIMLKYYDLIMDVSNRGVNIDQIRGLKNREPISRMATIPNETYKTDYQKMEASMEAEIRGLVGGGA